MEKILNVEEIFAENVFTLGKMREQIGRASCRERVSA